MNTIIECPDCGCRFETSAVTNTRCRECKRVVHVKPTLEDRIAKDSQASATDYSCATTPGVILLGGVLEIAVVVIVSSAIRAVVDRRTSGRVKPASLREEATQPHGAQPDRIAEGLCDPGLTNGLDPRAKAMENHE